MQQRDHQNSPGVVQTLSQESSEQTTWGWTIQPLVPALARDLLRAAGFAANQSSGQLCTPVKLPMRATSPSRGLDNHSESGSRLRMFRVCAPGVGGVQVCVEG